MKSAGAASHRPRARPHWPESLHSSQSRYAEELLNSAVTTISSIHEYGGDVSQQLEALPHQLAVELAPS